MESQYILYILIGVIVILIIAIIYKAIKSAPMMPDDYDLYNEDGDHIYYDRKLIKYKNEMKDKQNDIIGFDVFVSASTPIGSSEEEKAWEFSASDFTAEYNNDDESIMDLSSVDRVVREMGFAIICVDNSYAIMYGYYNAIYILCYDKDSTKNRVISKQDAEALIRIHELELLAETKYNKIWE